MVKNRIDNIRRILRAFVVDLISSKTNHNLRRQFVFIHIPKTGGTSLLMMLMESLHPHELYPNAWEYFIHMKSNQVTSADHLTGTNRDKIIRQRDWFVVHLDYHKASNLVENPILFTLLRNPFDRVVSEIVHLKCHDSAFKHLPLEQIIKKRIKIAGRLQAHLFGYREKLENLDEAIGNLHRCDFIGFSEKMTDSINSFNQLFGTSLRGDIHVNPGNPEIREEVIEKHRDQIEEHLTVDRTFYQSAPKVQ